MISENTKLAIAKYIIRNHRSDWWLDDGWLSGEEYQDQNGEIWAKSNECRQYVARLKKIKALW